MNKCNTSTTNSDKHKIFFAHAQLQNFKHKKGINSDNKRDKLVELDESLAGCLENVIKL